MDNFSNEDLDFIFKKGTSEPEFPFKESAWDNMEQILDADDKKRKYLTFLYSAIAILFISSVIYFGIHHFSDTEELVVAEQTQIIAFDNKIDSKSEISNKFERINEQENQNPVSKSSNIDFTKSKNSVVVQHGNLVVSKSTENLNLLNKKTSKFLSESSSDKNLVVQEDIISIAPRITNRHKQETSISSDIDSRITQSFKSETVISNDAVISTQSVIANPLPFAALNHISSVIEAPKRIEILPSKIKTNRFVYSGIAAYESSFVKGSSDRKSGYKVGAEVAYQFGSKFQVSAGLNFSRKRYETVGTNYSPVQARIQWVDDVPPETVSGTCSVFEIPVAFTYYLKNHRANGFFVGAGLNSYLMTNEWYDFDFDENYQGLNKSFWTTENNDAEMKKHFLSIVTAQFGYQHQVSKNLAFQISPFVQLPLSGIGYGDVDLISSGIQVKMSFAK